MTDYIIPILKLLLSAVLLFVPGALLAAEVRVAVASNFSPVMTIIARQFEDKTGHDVILLSGSTGKLYAQIRNGLPVDLFLAADDLRPAMLERDQLAIHDTRFTYTIGRLVLWSPVPGYVDREGKVLHQPGRTKAFRFLSIANPRLAPYGRAAREVLQSRGLWESLTGKIVRGENIGQAYQYVKSGNAQLGFIAASQLFAPGKQITGSWWQVPETLHSPIIQQAVLIKDSPAGRALVDFLKSERSLEILRGFGYANP